MYRSCLGVDGRRCGRLIETNRRRCRECQRANDRAHNAARPLVLRQLYSSSAWQRLRADVVASGQCHWCDAVGLRLVGDHVVSPLDRPDLALEPSNIVAACYSCNNARRRTWHLTKRGARR
jgi:5-methylcytosine-specific restriction endonuclease McrA